MSNSETGVSGNFESVGEVSPPATAAAAPSEAAQPPAEPTAAPAAQPPAQSQNASESGAAAQPSAAAPQEDAGTQERFEAMLQELHKQGVSAPGTVAAAGTENTSAVAPKNTSVSQEAAATAPPVTDAAAPEVTNAPAGNAAAQENSANSSANSNQSNESSQGNSNESSQENTWEREAREYEAAEQSATAGVQAQNQSENANTSAAAENQVALMPGENFTLAPIPPTSLNEQASNEASPAAAAAPVEAISEAAPAPAPAEASSEAAAPMAAPAAPPPAPAPGRTEKQAEADAGQAFWLGQLKQRYDAEFANIPEKFRPKPKAYVARAVFYKPESERETYIQEWLQKDREAAEVRQGKRERRTVNVEPIPEEASLRSELISRGPENTSLSIELAKGAQVAISASPLKAQTFKAKERLTHLADRTFDRVVAQAKDPETRRIAKKMVGEFRRQVTLLTREYQVQAKELERAARKAVQVEARKLAGRIEAPSSTRRASRSKSGSTRRRSKQSSRD